MDMSPTLLALIVGTLFFTGFGPAASSDLFGVDVRRLAETWEREHISPSDPFSLKHTELKSRLETFARDHPGFFRLEEAGRSVEDRAIFLVTIGAGADRILFWSQMHGDEPTATNSLIDLFQFFARHRDEAWVRAILQKYTLLFVPMLNPDGAERPQRRNAQGIDINRDARVLQTPEGRLLKRIRDRHAPFLGFNLHNQNALTTVGDTGRVATIALLAVAADAPAGTAQASDASGRLLAKRVTAVLYEALSPFVYGHISRYDETYNPRAFGDNITQWGTPVVLIESGGHPAGAPADFTVKLNFVAILAALDSLAGGRVERANPAVFDSLKLNSDDPIYDLLLRGAWVFTGSGIPLFRGDVAVRRDARAGAGSDAIIADIGDLGVFTAHETVDCSRFVITPGLIAWAPGKSALVSAGPDDEYLRRGVTTLLENADLGEVEGRDPAHEIPGGRTRPLNWSFVVSGRPSTGNREPERLLASWLAAGGRAWVFDDAARSLFPAGAERIPGWFGLEALHAGAAEQYRLPAVLEGRTETVLKRFTADAARHFRIARRGTISLGAIADLVLWSVPDGAPPFDMRDCRPVRLVVNGRLFDATGGPVPQQGRFIGR